MENLFGFTSVNNTETLDIVVVAMPFTAGYLIVLQNEKDSVCIGLYVCVYSSLVLYCMCMCWLTLWRGGGVAISLFSFFGTRL